MHQTQSQLKDKIRRILDIWQTIVFSENRCLDGSSINTINENLYCRLFNMVWGYQFKTLAKGFAGIDLDTDPILVENSHTKAVAAQVTANEKSDKIKKTVDKFIKLKNFNKYHKLMFIYPTFSIDGEKNRRELCSKLSHEYSIEIEIKTHRDLLDKLSNKTESFLKEVLDIVLGELKHVLASLVDDFETISGRSFNAKHFAIKVEDCPNLLVLHCNVEELKFGREAFGKRIINGTGETELALDERFSDVLTVPMLKNNSETHSIEKEHLSSLDFSENREIISRAHFAVVYESGGWYLVHLASTPICVESSRNPPHYQKANENGWNSKFEPCGNSDFASGGVKRQAAPRIAIYHGLRILLRGKFELLFHLHKNRVLHIHGLGKDNPMGWSVIFAASGDCTYLPEDWVRYHTSNMKTLPNQWRSYDYE